MKKVGIVGLGIMGSGMADNFLEHGYEVYVWNRHKDKARPLADKGAIVCDTPRDVASSAEMVFEVTADDSSSKKVWNGDDGILSGASPGTVLVASATLSIPWVDKLAKQCDKKGFTFFDMALTGSRIAAESGELVLLVGGDEQKLGELWPTLEAIAQKTIYLGAAGQGMRFKLLLNVLQAIHIVGFGEVMRIAEEAGMDIDKVADALADRPGGTSTAIARGGYHNQPDQVSFSVGLVTKDLGYAKKFAGPEDTPLLDDVLEKFRRSVQDGKSGADWTSINEKADG